MLSSFFKNADTAFAIGTTCLVIPNYLFYFVSLFIDKSWIVHYLLFQFPGTALFGYTLQENNKDKNLIAPIT